MREIFGRLKRRTSSRNRSSEPVRDWSTNWTPRDWADLPTHHPRSDSDLA